MYDIKWGFISGLSIRLSRSPGFLWVFYAFSALTANNKKSEHWGQESTQKFPFLRCCCTQKLKLALFSEERIWWFLETRHRTAGCSSLYTTRFQPNKVPPNTRKPACLTSPEGEVSGGIRVSKALPCWVVQQLLILKAHCLWWRSFSLFDELESKSEDVTFSDRIDNKTLLESA